MGICSLREKIGCLSAIARVRPGFLGHNNKNRRFQLQIAVLFESSIPPPPFSLWLFSGGVGRGGGVKRSKLNTSR